MQDPETVDRTATALLGRPLVLHEWAEAIGAPAGAALRIVAQRDELRVYADHAWACAAAATAPSDLPST